jgi:hypothetical protein
MDSPEAIRDKGFGTLKEGESVVWLTVNLLMCDREGALYSVHATAQQCLYINHPHSKIVKFKCKHDITYGQNINKKLYVNR